MNEVLAQGLGGADAQRLRQAADLGGPQEAGGPGSRGRPGLLRIMRVLLLGAIRTGGVG
nr:hypothetical protein [Actinomyces sp. Marseille-P3109]